MKAELEKWLLSATQLAKKLDKSWMHNMALQQSYNLTNNNSNSSLSNFPLNPRPLSLSLLTGGGSSKDPSSFRRGSSLSEGEAQNKHHEDVSLHRALSQGPFRKKAGGTLTPSSLNAGNGKPPLMSKPSPLVTSTMHSHTDGNSGGDPSLSDSSSSTVDFNKLRQAKLYLPSSAYHTATAAGVTHSTTPSTPRQPSPSIPPVPSHHEKLNRPLLGRNTVRCRVKLYQILSDLNLEDGDISFSSSLLSSVIANPPPVSSPSYSEMLKKSNRTDEHSEHTFNTTINNNIINNMNSIQQAKSSPSRIPSISKLRLSSSNQVRHTDRKALLYHLFRGLSSLLPHIKISPNLNSLNNSVYNKQHPYSFFSSKASYSSSTSGASEDGSINSNFIFSNHLMNSNVLNMGTGKHHSSSRRFDGKAVPYMASLSHRLFIAATLLVYDLDDRWSPQILSKVFLVALEALDRIKFHELQKEITQISNSTLTSVGATNNQSGNGNGTGLDLAYYSEIRMRTLDAGPLGFEQCGLASLDGQALGISKSVLFQLSRLLPLPSKLRPRLRYSSKRNGFLLSTLLDICCQCEQKHNFGHSFGQYGCCLLLIKEDTGHIFGGYLSFPLKEQTESYGNDSCRVFTVCPQLKVYIPNGK